MHVSEDHAYALQDVGFSCAVVAGRGEDALGSHVLEFENSLVAAPEDAEKPNKSYYDPRKWLREAEITMAERAQQSCVDHSNVN